MGTLFRLLRRTLLGLLLLLALTAAGAAALIWLTLPAQDESLRLPGLGAPVEVTLDAHGVPRIAAASERDAAMALGFLHARDRLFQMEMMRRGASGRLAEVAGAPALRLDRFMRTLGLVARAEIDFAELPADTRDLLEAYAAGVNARIAQKGFLAAPEFLLLGEPEPWRPRDSLLWGKVMGLWLSGNWRTELDRARLAGVLAPERLRELWPSDDTPGRPDLRAALDADSLARLVAMLPRWPGDAPLPPAASNSWAVAPARSATGGALLANDPHLGFQAPILWYLARIELPGGRFLAGATSPGVPFIVIGRNERLAWGFTTTHSDTQDVFVERLVGAEQYETPDGAQPFMLREERIAVRFGMPEILRVRETRHGPVISDLAGVATPTAGTALAVAMANLLSPDSAAAGLHALNRAGDMAAARAAAALIASPPQNLMVADADGAVAMYLTGRVPLRRAGDGSLPVPGWDGSHDWVGFVPFDALPHVEAPDSGALVNANNRVVPPDSAVFLGRDWFGDGRFRRIWQLLDQRERHAPGDFVAMQNDALSLHAQELLPLLLRLPRPDGMAGAARDLLLGWDGVMAIDRPQPLLFNAWAQAMGRRLMAAGGVPEGAWQPSSDFLRAVLGPAASLAHWCGSTGCEALVAAAWGDAVADLASRFGGAPGDWRWGAAHVARFEHPLLRFVPLVSDWVRLAVAMPGDENTVNRGGLGPGFADVHGPGLRLVADAGDRDGLWAMLATGQSGHPLSPHWGDLAPRWAAGAMLQLTARPAMLAGSLRLAP